MIRMLLHLLFLALLVGPVIEVKAQQPLRFTVLQLNDVYEIAPLQGGKEGGMARVATIRKELLSKTPHVITVLAGDFVSPSLMGTLSYYDSTEKKMIKVAGKQMVELMNAVGVDYVTFGNHEFDISSSLLNKRINESAFTWVNSNVWNAYQTPFLKLKSDGSIEKINAAAVRTLDFPGGGQLKAGFIGVTLPFNYTQPGLYYTNVDSSVKAAYDQLSGSCDVIMGLTHLSIEEDKQLAGKVPGLHLILGGHEHVHSYTMAGGVPIAKADANAKSVYIHYVSMDPVTRKVSIQSELRMVDETVAIDPDADKLVQKWVQFTDSTLRKMGYDPADSLLFARQPLDGRESEIRNHATNYTKLIADAIYNCDSTVDLALYNSGSLRVDDQLSGTVTQYDVLRSLPFGGSLVTMNLPGGVLRKLLTVGTTLNRNSGGYLQLAKAEFRRGLNGKPGMWLINRKPLDDRKTYRVLLPEFVARGNEFNLGFMNQFTYCTPSAFKQNKLRNDIRDVVIWFMKNKK